MKAIVQTRYGAPEEVLELRDIDMPVPGADQVRVRVHAASVHADVWHVVVGLPYVLRWMGSGIRAPKYPVPGTDLAGVVESVGTEVTRFKVGDAVFGESHSGMQWKNGGAFAEYACVGEDGLATKPETVSFEQAAAVPTAGYIALANMRGRAAVQAGQHMLINGAGGGVGSIALQVAKARGATVTAVDTAEKLDMLRRLGADRVVDYKQQDVTRLDARFHIIFDVASTLKLSDCKRIFEPEGVYVIIGHDHYGTAGRRVLGSIPQMFALMARAPFSPHLASADFSLPDKQEVMNELKTLLETGQLTPVIDRTFGLDEVHNAILRLKEGRGLGKIILTP